MSKSQECGQSPRSAVLNAIVGFCPRAYGAGFDTRPLDAQPQARFAPQPGQYRRCIPCRSALPSILHGIWVGWRNLVGDSFEDIRESESAIHRLTDVNTFQLPASSSSASSTAASLPYQRLDGRGPAGWFGRSPRLPSGTGPARCGPSPFRSRTRRRRGPARLRWTRLVGQN